MKLVPALRKLHRPVLENFTVVVLEALSDYSAVTTANGSLIPVPDLWLPVSNGLPDCSLGWWRRMKKWRFLLVNGFPSEKRPAMFLTKSIKATQGSVKELSIPMKPTRFAAVETFQKSASNKEC